MKFTVIGDPHCKVDNLIKIQKLCQLVESLKLPAIWLGDMLDTKEIINGQCLNQWLDYFSNSKLDHIVLVGNHDWFNKDCVSHSLQFLKTLQNVQVVDRPVFDRDLSISYYPYLPMDAILSYLKNDSSALVFGHFDIQNFNYGNGIYSQEGFTIEDFHKNLLVVSGHYHLMQEKRNIFYLGTPFSHSFGESNQKKYIMTIDVKTLKYELIETGLPQHKTYEIDCSVYYNLDKFKLDQVNYYRVVLTGTEEQIQRFQKDKYPFVKFLERPVLNNKSILIEESMDHVTQFVKWSEENKISEKTIEKGIEVLKNV